MDCHGNSEIPDINGYLQHVLATRSVLHFILEVMTIECYRKNYSLCP